MVVLVGYICVIYLSVVRDDDQLHVFGGFLGMSLMLRLRERESERGRQRERLIQLGEEAVSGGKHITGVKGNVFSKSVQMCD